MKSFLTLIISGFSVVCMAQSLSFPQALDKMYASNQKLKGTEKQVEGSAVEEKINKGLYMPQISLNASYLHLSDPLYLDFNSVKTQAGNRFSALASSPVFAPLISQLSPLFQKDWVYEFQKPDIFRLTADLKWVVYAGGKIRQANKISGLKTQIASQESQKIENLLISELAERYFQTQLAHSAIETRQKSLASAQNHFQNAQKLEKNGMIASIEVLQAEKSLTDAQRELLLSQKDLELSLAALSGVMGQENEPFGQLSTPLFEVVGLEKLEYYQSKAKENYPLLVQARLKKEMASENIKVQQSSYLPNVAIVGKKYLYNKNLPLTEPNNWYVGVGVEWNIFNGMQDKNKIAHAKIMKESAEMLTIQAEKDIQTLVKKFYTEIEKHQEQFHSLEKSLAFAQELVRVRQKSFAEGLSTSTDVADAQLYLASIEIQRYQALFQMDKTLAQLLETCGLSSEFSKFLK